MRLIDADALINKLPNAKEKDGKISFNGALADIIMMIEDAPTIDAVPVIRCKDCRFFNADYCCLFDDNKAEDSFCSDGAVYTDE